MTDEEPPEDDTREWKRELRRADLPEELHQPYDALMIAHREVVAEAERVHQRGHATERAYHRYLVWTGVCIGCAALNLLAGVAVALSRALQ